MMLLDKIHLKDSFVVYSLSFQNKQCPSHLTTYETTDHKDNKRVKCKHSGTANVLLFIDESFAA